MDSTQINTEKKIINPEIFIIDATEDVTETINDEEIRFFRPAAGTKDECESSLIGKSILEAMPITMEDKICTV